jgi:hypothetical protein
MVDIVRAGNPADFTLSKESGLKITADAASNGKVWVLSGSSGSYTTIDYRVVSPGETESIGPYNDPVRIHAECYAGTLTCGPLTTREEVRKFGSTIKKITTTTYTLSDADHGFMLDCQGGCAITIPQGLRSDFSAGWSQSSSTAVTFVAGSGVTLQDALGGLASAGLYKMGGIASFDLNLIRVF